jgi:2,4-dienoyl-CoA reductase-like NADH-dependent reductase (Old Yellow Enzyme family)/thioredoxin reductase
MAEFEHLFRPIQIGTMTVPNRIAVTTYSINAGRADGLPDQPFREHHVERARGGAGWIGGETWVLPTPLPPGRGDEILQGQGAIRGALYEHPHFVDRVRTFTDAVHEYGSVCVMQLTHLQTLMCPSPVQIALNADYIPHELDEEEIDFILDTYANAADAFHKAGADAVEIHCAHETLPQWFFSPRTNRREDRWGGNAENRIRFVTEAVRRIRDRVPRELNVGLRICADEHSEDGYTLDDMQAMMSRLCAAVTVDFLNVDVGSTYGSPSYVPPMQVEVAAYASHAAAIRRAVGVPVIYAGRVNDPVVAERLLGEGAVDLVGMTRALLADPELPRKTREGRRAEIRKCIACNTCIGTAVHGEVKTPRCAVNPVVGHELEWAADKPAERSKRVCVIGGGPAGLETARVAAMRGHTVTLIERSAELGGLMRVAAKAPRREAFLDFPRFAEGALERLGVEVRRSAEATPESILADRPDAVVVATGSVARRGEFPGAGQDNVVDFVSVLTGKARVGQRVVVVSEDDHMQTPSVADFLAAQGKEVEILQKWLMIGDKVERYTRGVVFRRLYEQGVVISPSTRVRAVGGNTVIAFNAHTGAERRIENVDTVVLSLGTRSESSLYRELKDRVDECYLVGSAFAPRLVAEATQHGANVARLL